MLHFAMASRGCQCTKTCRAPLHLTGIQGVVTKTKSISMVLYEAQHSGLLTDHYSTAITNCLFNRSFWAAVEQTKELQDILSTFERWSHLATLWSKETTKRYTITFPKMIPQVLETCENGYFHWRTAWFTVLKSSFE